MNRTFVISVLTLMWAGAGLGAGGSGGSTATVAGLIRFEPPQPLGCVAVRVDVPADQMLTGVRWRNGSAALSFQKVLVASGNGLEPPAYSEAVVVAEAVVGIDDGWSSVQFAAPVASGSGTLFVIIQYPSDYEPGAGGAQLGVGWSEDEAQFTHFVTGDGSTWIKVASSCRVLVEPVLEELVPGVTLMGSMHRRDEPNVPGHVGLSVAPNPFNPETQIDLYLGAASTGTVRVLDLRGRLVAELHHGPVQAGHNVFVWDGRDRSGNPVAGVYSVLAETPDQRHLKKVLLIK